MLADASSHVIHTSNDLFELNPDVHSELNRMVAEEMDQRCASLHPLRYISKELQTSIQERTQFLRSNLDKALSWREKV